MGKARLSDVVHIGDFVATTNVVGYEGCEIGVYMGVASEERRRRWGNQITNKEGLIFIQWINSSRYGLQGVFLSDFNKTFYKIKLMGLDRNRRVIFKKIKNNYQRTH